MQVAVSIIIPLYNVELFINACVQSVLQQKFEDWELILIDDASTDGTYKLAEELAAKDQRIRLFQMPENSGVSKVRNFGVEEAKGEYVAFIDGDDEVGENYLRDMYAAAISNNADVVAVGQTVLAYKGERWELGGQEFLVDSLVVMPEDKKERLNLMLRDMVDISAHKLIRRSLFTDTPLRFDLFYMEDRLFAIPLLYFAEKYIVIPKADYHYRISPFSILRTADAKKYYKAWEGILNAFPILDLYLDKMPEVKADLGLVCNLQIYLAKWLFWYLDRMAGGTAGDTLLSAAASVLQQSDNPYRGIILYFYRLYLVDREARRKKEQVEKNSEKLEGC